MEYLPVSKINTVVFCPRRYYIEHVMSETVTNHHLIEGSSLHERSTRSGEGIWVWSDRLGLSGILDQLTREDGHWVITELKKGYLAEHQSDMVQLCALAICYEESYGETLDYGYIYYERTRRRLKVSFDASLRQSVDEAVEQMRELSAQTHYPPVTENPNKCQGCSVKEACQPGLFRKRRASWRVVGDG